MLWDNKISNYNSNCNSDANPDHGRSKRRGEDCLLILSLNIPSLVVLVRLDFQPFCAPAFLRRRTEN